MFKHVTTDSQVPPDTILQDVISLIQICKDTLFATETLAQFSLISSIVLG